MEIVINDFIKKLIEIIEARLKILIPEDHKYIGKLYESMRYSVFAGGKRLRPILCITAYNMFSDDYEKVLDIACSLEMIHTYSLIHDDLPCMDNDDYRRGKFTNHKVYGEDYALLAGDALLNMGVEVMLNAAIKNSENYDRYIRAIYDIMSAVGTKGMIGGQFVDIKSEGKNLDKETLMYMHKNKTGALITAALTSGAIVGGATEEELNRIKSYGDKLGLAFQIQDDILDVEGDQALIGKPVGSDMKNCKSTYVSLYGLKESKAKVDQLIHEAEKDLTGFKNSEKLLELTEYILNRKK